MSHRDYTTYQTHPEGATKAIHPAPRKGQRGETPIQRRDRLYHQAAENGCRVHDNGDGSFTVPSQRTGADGQPLGAYVVHQLVDGGLSCPCDWGDRHGPYTDDNPYGCCGHTAKVELFLQRKAAAALRAIRAGQAVAA
jgi:hypothetical protein